MQINIPALLKTAYDMKMDPNDIADVLTVIFDDLEPNFIKEEDLDFISSILHNFYTIKSMSVKSSVLKAFLQLEILHDTAICEKYHIDLLIAESLALQRTENIPKVDTEKSAAFSYVYYLLNVHNFVPKSIISALITLINQDDKFFQSLAISYLCDAILSIDQTDFFPEIYPIITDYLLNNSSPALCGLITYGLENSFSMICEANTLRPLISPFCEIIDAPFPQHTFEALTSILCTWPGLIIFGIKNHGIDEIVKCLSHCPKYVAPLLIALLKPCINSSSLTSGFCGTMMSAVLKNTNLLNILPHVAQTSKDAMKLYDLLRPIIRDDFSMQGAKPENSLSYNLSKTINILEDVPSIVQAVTQHNSSTWNWQSIINFLTYVLPYSKAELSTIPKLFFTNLLDFFSTTFVTLSQTKALPIKPALMATIKCLIKISWGVDVIEQHKGFMKMIHDVLNIVASPKVLDYMSPLWTFVDVFMFLLTDEKGVGIWSRSGFLDDILSFGDKITQPYNFEATMSRVNFYPDTHLVIPMYSRMLLVSTPKMHAIALSDLWKKHGKTPDFANAIFKNLIIPYAITVLKLKDMNKLTDVTHLICEIVSADRVCLSFAAKSQNIHNIFSNHYRSLYPYILCHEDSLAYVDIEKEIEWWMSEGSVSFVNSFDEAYELSFTGKPFTEPTHLFGQLAKIRKGCEAIERVIPKVIEQIDSDNDTTCRSALLALGHFASSPLATSQIEKLEIANRMINAIIPTTSPILLGTLITSLSMFRRTPKFLEVMKNRGWMVYNFAHRSCVLPVDISQVLVSRPQVSCIFRPIPDIKGKEKLCKMIKELANPVIGSNAIDEINNYEPKSDFKTPELHVYADTVICEFMFPQNKREVVDKIFSSVPMMEIPQREFPEDAVALSAAIIAECPTLVMPLPFVKIPKISPKDIKKKAKQKSYPEVYLSDSDFESFMKMNREAFYALPAEEKKKLREKLLVY